MRLGVLRALGCGLLGPSGRWSCFSALGCSSTITFNDRRRMSGLGSSSINVFNREMKKKQKNWAASLEEAHQYDYLRDEVRTGTDPVSSNESRG